jgi:rubrerythrin
VPVRPAPPVPSKYTDKILVCVGCQVEFVWKASDQLYYAKQGFTPPKWCPVCKSKRREYFNTHPEQDRKERSNRP